MKKIVVSLTVILCIALNFVLSVGAQEDYSHISGEDFFNDTVDSLKNGDTKISPQNIFKYILDTLTGEMKESRSLILSIFVIALMSGMLTVMKEGDAGAGDAAFFVCFCLITIAVSKIITIAAGYGTDVIAEMTDFVTKLAPMLTVLLVSGGYAVSATAFYPIFSASVWIIGVIMEKCIVPLIYISAVTGIVNNMSGKVRLNNFNKLVKTVARWILAGVLTIFSAVNAIYGFCVPTLDSVGIKTAKFAIGSIVPVVGGFLADSVETVIGSAHLIKNSVGTAGIICIGVMCAVPAIKVCAMMLMLKISAALIEPVSDKRFSDMLSEAADAVTLVFAAILIISLMFILSIAIIIATTNVNA